MNTKSTSLEESLAEYTAWANQLAEDNSRVVSDSPLTAPETTDSRAQAVRSKKQDILKQFAQLGPIRTEFIWASEHDVFMNKDQILDYLDQTVEDPELTPLEYMHNNGFTTDGLLKGMLKSMASIGLSKADIFGIFKSARRGNTNAAPGTISRAAKGLLRSEMVESVPDEKTWYAQIKAKHPDARFIQAKMPGAPIRAIANGEEVGRFETPKPVNETGSRSQEEAKKAYNFIRDNWMDDVELRKYAGTTKSPQSFFKAVQDYRMKDSENRIITSLARAFDSVYTGSTDSPWYAKESVNEKITNRLKFLAGILK